MSNLTRSSPPMASIQVLGLNLTVLLGLCAVPAVSCNLTAGSIVIAL